MHALAPDNGRLGLPSELALLLLMDPTTGVPIAIVDATAITAMRTGAVTVNDVPIGPNQNGV